jgi:hypothetical protein
MVELDPAPPPGTRHIFRNPGGGFSWFGADEQEDGPDLVRILYDGTRLPFFQGPGDQSVQDLSPEGRRVLFTSENVGQTPFSHSIYWARLDGGGEPHLIYRGSRVLGTGKFSPDGDMVAFKIGSASDSLAVYSLAGDRVWAMALGEVFAIDWCGESIYVISAPEEQAFLYEVGSNGERITQIAPSSVGRRFACSPDGTALVQIDVVDGRPSFLIRNLATGETHLFNTLDVDDSVPGWLPDAVTHVPVEVRAEDDTVRIDWGDHLSLMASVISSDNSESTEGIWWESLDPDVANFNPDQELTGNRAGLGRVVARWGASLRDTVAVIVEDTGVGDPRAFLRERWDSLDPDRWRAFGSHPPIATTFEGEPVLQILGDEKYADGVMLNEAIPLEQGITVEFEFRMALTEDVHQNVSLCLRDTSPLEFDPGSGTHRPTGEIVCLLYPSREFEKLNPSEVSLRTTPGVETRARIPEALPTQGWTHIALQVRPDGETSLVVDRERVATSPVLLTTQPKYQWTLLVDGDAVGTELFIRDLNIWREIRY